MYKPSTVVITRLTMYLIVKVNECVDRKGKIMDTRHKLPAIMCVLTYLNRGQNVFITVNYIQTTHSSNFVYIMNNTILWVVACVER